jgi:hypothetical protein
MALTWLHNDPSPQVCLPRSLARSAEEYSNNYRDIWMGEDYIAGIACVLNVPIYILNEQLLLRTDFFSTGEYPCMAATSTNPRTTSLPGIVTCSACTATGSGRTGCRNP